MLNHAALETLIQQQKWWFSAAELHGILSALSALNQEDNWKEMLGLGDNATAATLMPELLKSIHEALADSDLSFALLLPEETAFSERAEALSYWAEGFSLATEYLREAHKLPKLEKNSKEFLEDVAEIKKLDSHLPDNEENRRMLSDLEEHLRMGAIFVFLNAHQPK